MWWLIGFIVIVYVIHLFWEFVFIGIFNELDRFLPKSATAATLIMLLGVVLCGLNILTLKYCIYWCLLPGAFILFMVGYGIQSLQQSSREQQEKNKQIEAARAAAAQVALEEKRHAAWLATPPEYRLPPRKDRPSGAK